MKTYKLAITVSHFDNKTGDVKKSFHKFWDKEGRKVEIEELSENNHISGIIHEEFTPKKGISIIGQVQEFIKKNHLEQECWSLLDENDEIICLEHDL